MNDEIKKNVKLLTIIIFIFLVLTIVLLVIKKSTKGEEKVLSEYNYIIEKETDFSSDEDKGLLPIINLKGEDIEKINEEIITKYYGIAYSEYDIFKYEYYTYDNILSILLTLTYVDNSEYGNIEYYSYNIDTETNSVLSNEELLSQIDVNNDKYNEKITDRIKDYYNTDSLKEQISYDEYKETINFNESDVKLVISDKKLYGYISLNVTESLLTYQGNINEIEILELK